MNIPKEITFMLRDPSVKKAWISEFPQIHSGDCRNCGGAGVIAAFIATEGPYDQPAGPYAQRTNGEGKKINLTSKTEVINGQVKYWVGQTVSVACPDCQNTAAPKAISPAYHYAKPAIKQLGAQFGKSEREEYHDQ